jgi:hypothetical protein
MSLARATAPRLGASQKEKAMRFDQRKRLVAGGILAAAACGLLLANFAQPSLSRPTSSNVAGEVIVVDPFPLMRQAPLDLAAEQYDAH